MLDNTTPDNDSPPAGDVAVVVAAGGDGRRMDNSVHKPFIELAGEPILFRACRRLKNIPDIFEIIVAVHENDLHHIQNDRWEEALDAGITLAVAGGKNRAESVWNAIQVVSARAKLIAVHDGVRPFVSTDTVKALVSTARRRGAAIPVVQTVDTLKRVEGDTVAETIRRLGLYRVQTPQVFNSDLLIEAYEYALRTGGLTDAITDDAQMVEQMGADVAAVISDEFNLKITSPTDLKIARALLAAGLVE